MAIMLDGAGRTPSLPLGGHRAAPPSADGIGDSFLDVVKTNIGIGWIVGIGRAGSPDITEGVELTIGPNTWPVGRSPRRDRGDGVSCRGSFEQ